MQLYTNIEFIDHAKIDPGHFPFFYQENYSLYLAEKDEKGVGVISDAHGNSMAVRLWRLRFISVVQPLYPPLDRSGRRLSEEKELQFNNQFVNFVRKRNLAQKISQPENFCIFKTVPKGAISAPFGTYFLDLEKHTEEELFANMHPKHRNVIRNAERKDVAVKFGKETLEDFYELYKDTTARSGIYCEPFSYFKDQYEYMPENMLCGVSYADGVPQGGIFIPYSAFGAFYTHGASARQINVTGSVNLLHWEAIKYFKKKGIKRYDFVGARLSDISGSRLEGIQQFKSRFGAELEKGYIWKKNLDRFENLVFDLASYSKQRMKGYTPVMDIIDEELKKIYVDKNSKTKALKKRLKKNRNRLIKSFRLFKKGIKKDQLIAQLKNSGLKEGDTLLVHSSLSKLGNINGGAKTVLEAFIEFIGPQGNIAFPTYSYINTMHETMQDKNFVFDPQKNPSIVGIISEEFRKWPGVKRSVHPTHSVSALGPDAGLITSGHLEALSNFGPGTPFHKLRELKGKIVGIGIPIGPVTIYHSVEDFFPALFKGVYFPKQISLNVFDKGSIVAKKIYIHNPTYHKSRIDKTPEIQNWFRDHLLKKGILHESQFGESNIWWMDIQELFDELLALKEKDISIYKVPNEQQEA